MKILATLDAGGLDVHVGEVPLHCELLCLLQRAGPRTPYQRVFADPMHCCSEYRRGVSERGDAATQFNARRTHCMFLVGTTRPEGVPYLSILQ